MHPTLAVLQCLTEEPNTNTHETTLAHACKRKRTLLHHFSALETDGMLRTAERQKNTETVAFAICVA